MLVSRDVVTQWLASNGGGSLTGDVIDTSYKAADDYVANRVRVFPAGEVPADVQLAVCLMTARYLARRNSPTGMVGIDDLAVAQIPGADVDVPRLLAPYRKVVFG